MKTKIKIIFRDTIGFRVVITKFFRDIKKEKIIKKNL